MEEVGVVLDRKRLGAEIISGRRLLMEDERTEGFLSFF